MRVDINFPCWYTSWSRLTSKRAFVYIKSWNYNHEDIKIIDNQEGWEAFSSVLILSRFLDRLLIICEAQKIFVYPRTHIFYQD